MANSWIIILYIPLLWVPSHCSQLSEEYYTTHMELENALIDSCVNNTIPNLYILAGMYFPMEALEPVCLSISYDLYCGSQNSCPSGDCIDCTNSTSYNATFLWTGYDFTSAIGKILLSYAWNGIEIKGFSNWEKTCLFYDETTLQLNVVSLTYTDREVVGNVLRKITSQLKKYAADQGKPKPGDSTYDGYALEWFKDEGIDSVFDNVNTVLNVEFVLLNIFIFFLSITMTTYSYDVLYDNIKNKKNPGYPIFWGLFVFSICWNIGTPFVALSRQSSRISYSLAVMIPLELVVAFFVKKKSDFPVPGMSPRGCKRHQSRDYFTWECMTITCCRCLVSHVVQIVVIWSILISITLLVYYLSSIIVAFYLYPSLTLVKLVFVKGVAVCTILIFALVFSQSKFNFNCCTREAFKTNIVAILSLLTVISFLPILAYLAFVIGGIIFAESAPDNSLHSILTLLPSVFLLFVAWVSRGHLFPEGLHNTDPTKEIESDLEKGATHHQGTEHPSGDQEVKRVAATPGKSELSTYNSIDQRKPLSLQTGHQVSEGGEKLPLIPSQA